MTARQTESPSHDPRRFTDMETTGYTIYPASPPPGEVPTRVKHSLQLNHSQETDNLIYGRGDPSVCGELLRYGTDENNMFDRKIAEAIGSVDFPVHQGPIIVLSNKQHSMQGPAHPTREAVSIFRDMADTDETRVTFILYAQYISPEEASTTPPIVRTLWPGEILFVKGSVTIRIKVPSGGSFVWQGNSSEPMGNDIKSPGIFPFMKI